MKMKFIILLIPLLLSCNNSVYVNNSKNVSSKYILYKNKYKYIEQSKTSKFKNTGSYEIKDSSIVFEHRDGNRIPYQYLNNNFQKLEKNENSDYIKLTVVSAQSNKPIIRALIIAKNESNLTIYSTDTDFDGIAKIKKDSSIKTLELSYVGFHKHTIDYEKMNRWNIIWKLDELEKGGRMSGACLGEYIDVLLEYKIDNPDSLIEFSNNGNSFKKLE